MKIAALLISILSCVFLCSCSKATTGYADELTSKIWTAELDGGGSAVLKFNGENACLSLESADIQKEISGKYLADEDTFVIFASESAQNYSFSYVPKGETLDVTYNGSTITFDNKS